ncbi:MAG: response regulator [Elusimicrobia bacterium]|nr:response regulator [Elusimicrobiota bacterium]
MNQQILRIMLVEDNPDDAWATREALAGDGDRFEIQHLRNLGDALERLEAGPVDVVLLGLGLPDSQGFDAIVRVRARSPGTPIVLMTGADDKAFAIRALQHGAQDYVVKGAYDEKRLPRIVLYAVERKRAENLARSSADRERFALVASRDLQEPLHKIMAYGNILMHQHGEDIGLQGRDLLSRMLRATERMAKLVSEMPELSHPAQAAGAPRLVDLNETVSRVLRARNGII